MCALVLGLAWSNCVYLCRYRPAAATFALTQASFEEVALKFIEVKEQDPLKVFLVKKLNNMDHKVCEMERAMWLFGCTGLVYHAIITRLCYAMLLESY